jgi:hypothetical protein
MTPSSAMSWYVSLIKSFATNPPDKPSSPTSKKIWPQTGYRYSSITKTRPLRSSWAPPLARPCLMLRPIFVAQYVISCCYMTI